MPPRRTLLIALALSFAAHAVWVLSPAWQLPELTVASDTAIEARFAPVPVRPVRIRAHVSTPAPAAAPEVADVGPAPTPEAPAPKPAPGAETPPAPLAQAQAKPEPSFPAAARLVFAVMRGEGGLLIGRSVQRWHASEGRYRLESLTTSAGLVAMFKTVRLLQTSEGALSDEGLRPSVFRTERDGKVTEEAHFDWAQNQLTLTSGDNTRALPLPPGAQDVLSLVYQTALTYRGDETMSVNVATGKSFNTYRLQPLGEEMLATRMGPLRALHIRRVVSAGEDGVEIWLARERHMLPVRIRFTDRKGDVYDQLIEEIDIETGRAAADGGAAPQALLGEEMK